MSIRIRPFVPSSCSLFRRIVAWSGIKVNRPHRPFNIILTCQSGSAQTRRGSAPDPATFEKVDETFIFATHYVLNLACRPVTYELQDSFFTFLQYDTMVWRVTKPVTR